MTSAVLSELYGDQIMSLKIVEAGDARRYVIYRSSEFSNASLRPHLVYESTGSTLVNDSPILFSSSEEVEVISTKKDYSIALFPNPTQEVLNINLQNYMDMATQYMIVSLKGEVLLRGEFTQTHAPTEVINVRNLPDGNYFIHIAPEKQATIAKPFVIVK